MPWRKHALRGKSVFARVDETGALVAEKGRVEIRYAPRANKSYRALASNLQPVEETVLPEAYCTLEAKETKRAKSSPRRPTELANPPTEPEENEILVYADGACRGNPGPAGVGVVMLWDNGGQELSEYIGEGTNNVAELTAILRALESLPDPSRPVRIFTDSTYSIGMLTKGWKPRANQALIKEIRSVLLKVPSVSFFYVRGHVGIALNERADELASEAAKKKKTARWHPLGKPDPV